MRDDDLALADERRQHRACAPQRRELLGSRPAPEGITPESDDQSHTTPARSPIRPYSPSTSASVGSPISSRR